MASPLLRVEDLVVHFPIRKGMLRHPTEFGTVVQVAELCENTRRGARGLILPLASEIGNRNENKLRSCSASARGSG